LLSDILSGIGLQSAASQGAATAELESSHSTSDRNDIAMEGGMNIIEKPAERKHLRLKGHDYSQAGAYFLTIGTHRMKCLFGQIVDGEMNLNDTGCAVERAWFSIPRHFPRAVLDEFVVMPNHVHGIIILMPDRHDSMPRELHQSEAHISRMPGSTNGVSQCGPKRGSIASIVGAFKSAASRCIHEIGSIRHGAIWHRNYYEHVVRNEESLARIREYIRANPQLWAKDRFNPAMRTR